MTCYQVIWDFVDHHTSTFYKVIQIITFWYQNYDIKYRPRIILTIYNIFYFSSILLFILSLAHLISNPNIPNEYHIISKRWSFSQLIYFCLSYYLEHYITLVLLQCSWTHQDVLPLPTTMLKSPSISSVSVAPGWCNDAIPRGDTRPLPVSVHDNNHTQNCLILP